MFETSFISWTKLHVTLLLGEIKTAHKKWSVFEPIAVFPTRGHHPHVDNLCGRKLEEVTSSCNHFSGAYHLIKWFFGIVQSTVYFLLLCNRFIWQQKSSYPHFYKYITIYTSDISIKKNNTYISRCIFTTYIFLQDVENIKQNLHFVFWVQYVQKLIFFWAVLFLPRSKVAWNTCLLINY